MSNQFYKLKKNDSKIWDSILVILPIQYSNIE